MSDVKSMFGGDLGKIAEFLDKVKLEENPDEDTSVHEDIQQWYIERMTEALGLGMKDVALAYHAAINKDSRLGDVEKTSLLIGTLPLFHGGDK